MDFFLNKIDPQIVKVIKKATATGVIHKKDDLPILKDEKGREEGKNRKNRHHLIKEQIGKLNQLADENQLEIFFVLEELSEQLWIKVYEKDSNTCIKAFDEAEIEDLISRLQNIMGIIVDVKR